MPRDVVGGRSRSGVGRPLMRTAGMLLVAVVAGGACTPLDNAMASIFGRSMRDQSSFDPYELPRLPAENAVPFASGNYPAQIGQVNVGQPEGLAADVPPFTSGDMARGGDVASAMENPVPADEASVERGRILYDRYCTVCHGPAGLPADAPIVDKLAVVQAFPLATGNAVGYSDGYIYGMIRVGRGLMPAYGHRVPHFDRWHIVNYVRVLQQQAGQGGGAPAAGDGGEAGAAGDTAAAGTAPSGTAPSGTAPSGTAPSGAGGS